MPGSISSSVLVRQCLKRVYCAVACSVRNVGPAPSFVSPKVLYDIIYALEPDSLGADTRRLQETVLRFAFHWILNPSTLGSCEAVQFISAQSMHWLLQEQYWKDTTSNLSTPLHMEAATRINNCRVGGA